MMTLPPREIRYKRSALYPILGLLVLFFIMMTYMIFFSGAGVASPPVSLSYLAFTIILTFAGFRIYKRFSSPRPVLVFHSTGLQIPGKKNRYIYWDEITEWRIRTYKNNKYLVIHTSTNKTRIDISWLEFPSKEIQRLMEHYIRGLGPDFAYN